MKKIFLSLILLIIALLSAVGFAACEDENGKTITPETPTHTHAFIETVINPTCTAGGYTLYKCTCGLEYKTDESAALGHDYEWTITKEPTEMEKGEKTGICTCCGDTVTKIIPSLTHVHNYTETVVEPGCTTDGYTLHVCGCGDEYTDNETPATGHDFSEWGITEEPTCTGTGIATRICSRDDTHIETREISATGHTPASAVQENYIAPTCTADGSYDSVIYCATCGEELSRGEITVAALGHNYQAENTVPTCTTQGYTVYTCTRCGNSYIGDYIAANGIHNYVNGVCSVCGAEEPTPDEYFTFTLLDDDAYEIWAKDRNNMPAKVILPSTHDNKPVTSIGDYAFYGCSSLTSITIPDSVTSIGSSAFWNCSKLTSITIPDSVTSIGSSAFSYCRSLTSIVVNENNEYYKSIDGNLYSKDGKTLIQYAIGKTDTTFSISDGVTSIGRYAFSGCSSLTSILIPNSVTSIGSEAFSSCSSLTSITIGGSVTSIGGYAFENCTSLTSISIPDSVTSIGYAAFYSCYSLTSINVLGNNAHYSSQDGILYNKNKTEIIQVPKGISGVITLSNSLTSIGNGAFSGCSSLTSITIPDSVTSIGEKTFYSCSSLYYVINKSNLTLSFGSTDNGYVSYYAKAIEDRQGNISYKNNTPVYIENEFMFAYESGEYRLIAYLGNKETVTLPLTYNGNPYTVYRMKGVKNVTISQGVTSIGDYAFYGCSSLTSITIPDSVTSIGDYAFSSCSSLTYNKYDNGLYLGNDNNPYVVLVKAKDTSITSCIINNKTKFIHDKAFGGCSSLTSIKIPDGVTSIGWDAFRDCSSLTSITIPDSVTSIGAWSFSNCSSLTSVTFNGTKAQWQSISKGPYWKSNVPSSCKVHCTDGDIAI